MWLDNGKKDRKGFVWHKYAKRKRIWSGKDLREKLVPKKGRDGKSKGGGAIVGGVMLCTITY